MRMVAPLDRGIRHHSWLRAGGPESPSITQGDDSQRLYKLIGAPNGVAVLFAGGACCDAVGVCHEAGRPALPLHKTELCQADFPGHSQPLSLEYFTPVRLSRNCIVLQST